MRYTEFGGSLLFTLCFELILDQSLGNLRIYFFLLFFIEAYKIKNSVFLSTVNLVSFLCLTPNNEIDSSLLTLNMKRVYAFI